MKKTLITLLISMIYSINVFALSTEIQYDMLKEKLKQEMADKKYSNAVKTMSRIKSPNVSIPKSFSYFEGKALFESGKKAQSYNKFVQYVESNGKAGKYYKPALSYMIKSEEAKNVYKQNVDKKRRKKTGYKKETYYNGHKYSGDHKNGKRHGQGTYTWPDGAKYVGEWKNGKRHGQGTNTWSDGEKYVGEFKNDKLHGQGVRTWTNGEKYVGEWKYGKKDGQGTMTWTHYKYVGEWKNGKRHGQGKFNAGGESNYYVGEWKNSKEHGQGVWTYHDGRKRIGMWKNGEFLGDK